MARPDLEVVVCCDRLGQQGESTPLLIQRRANTNVNWSLLLCREPDHTFSAGLEFGIAIVSAPWDNAEAGRYDLPTTTVET